MKNAGVRMTDVIASVNTLATQPTARDWSHLLTGIVARLSVADRTRISVAMHIGWNTSTEEIRAYARACVLIEAVLGMPILAGYCNPAQRITHYLGLWTGNAAAKKIAARQSLDQLLGANAPNYTAGGVGDYMRPLQPGASFSHADHGGPGTIGCFVRHRNTGVIYGLTNAHIMKVNPAGPHTADRVVIQPASMAGGGFAYIVGTFWAEQYNAQMDAALFQLDNGIAWTNTTPDGQLIAGQNAVVALNQAVSKYGSRTRRQNGVIDNLNFSPPPFVGQYRVVGGAGFQSNGDSGSVLVNAANQAVALMHLGGDNINFGFATPIMTVLNHFNVDIA
jgi:hypothetical protein